MRVRVSFHPQINADTLRSHRATCQKLLRQDVQDERDKPAFSGQPRSGEGERTREPKGAGGTGIYAFVRTIHHKATKGTKVAEPPRAYTPSARG